MSIDSQPLVSVIIPTYKRAALLPRAIRSVLGQTYRNLELIVVDDASPDNTREVVQQFRDSRLHYVRLERNSRAATARNVGMQTARGELLAFNDDDDIWLTHKLERQVAHLLASPAEVGLSICGHICEYRTHAIYIGGKKYFDQLAFDGISDPAPLISTPGWLVKRRYLDQTDGFDGRMRCWDDWELACRLSRVCRFAHLDEPLFLQDQKRLIGESSMTGNIHDFANDFLVLFDRHAHEWPQPRRQSRHMYAIGHHLVMFDQHTQGRGWLRRALRADIFNYKAWASLALSYLFPGRIKALTLAIRQVKIRMGTRKVLS